jgi:hypothetical protein
MDKKELKEHAYDVSPNRRTRRWMVALAIITALSFLTAVTAGYYAWRNAHNEALAGKQLAEQLRRLCDQNGTVEFENRNLCKNAKEVVKDGAEIQDKEIDDPDPNDPDPVDDPDPNDPDPKNDPEKQDQEVQDDETQDSDPNDPDPVDDPDPDDPDPDDPDPNDPDPDDPDPASPYDFTFQFTVPGPGGSPGTTYTVTCNSGTGACTVN